MCMLDMVRAKRSAVMKIAAANKIGEVLVFGSCARKEYGSISDIDFLVTFEDGASLLNQVHRRLLTGI